MVRPLRREAIVDELADRIVRVGSARVRVLVDGAPPTGPAAWATDLRAALELRGRPVLVADADDFLRPASVRLERGRTDPDAYVDDRLDVGAIRRELLEPVAAGGSGRVLPRWWDPTTDRSARADYLDLPPRAVVVLHGAMLLGAGLPAEVEVHLHLSEAALRRQLDPVLAWTLPAWARYDREARPTEIADVTVLLDDPRRPALR